MHHFEYKDGIMFAEDVAIPEIAKAVGTPFYLYSTATLEHHYKVFSNALSDMDSMVFFAIKSNSNIAVIKTLARLGAGADVVSEGELRRALTAGIPASKICFSGVGKTKRELTFALEQDILCFNVESEPELEMLSTLASQNGKTARISLRINPDVDAHTHAKMSTGKAEDKFGISWEVAPKIYDKAASLPGIKVTGIDMHIGSQIVSLDPFKNAFALIAQLVKTLREKGHNIEHVDVGGGLGIPYHNDQFTPPLPLDYVNVIKQELEGIDCQIFAEPGRMITGNAGILVTEVIYRKQGEGKTFLIVDGAMNDLIRPTLYEAWHEAKPIREPQFDTPMGAVDIVGPICETGDFLAQNRPMPTMEPGDLVAIMTAGAYGAVQANSYNTRLLVPEILVKGKEWGIIRSRPSYDDLLGLDTIPNWLD